VPDSFDVAFDDTLNNFAPQNSSQWDGLTHVRHPSLGFYNGFRKEHLTGDEDTKLGIEHWARRGIVGRGVLLDVERYLRAQGTDYDPGATFLITVDMLEGARRSQGVELRQGDILLLRTGWVKYYLGLPQSERDKLGHEFQAAGLRPGNDMAEYLWNHHIAAIGSDCPSVERWPIDQETGFFHIQMIVLFGMAIGELWDLEALAEDCAQDGVYECMVTSAPLHLRGGVGSPPNALAIK
jgi:kynurenine formamidase